MHSQDNKRKILGQIFAHTVIFLLFILMLLPVTTSASLVPCNGVNTTIDTSGNESVGGGECHWADFVQLANNILLYIINASVIIATITFAVIGYKYITEKESTNKTAHNMLQNTVLGFLLILGAELLVKWFLGFLLKDGYTNLLQ